MKTIRLILGAVIGLLIVSCGNNSSDSNPTDDSTTDTAIDTLAKSANDEDEQDADLLDETLVLTEDQLKPASSYDVNDFDFERFGDFTDNNILSQLWNKDDEQYLKKAKVKIYLRPDRLEQCEEVVLYAHIQHETEDVDNSLWYVTYNNNKVIDYVCLSEFKQEAGSLKKGQFVTKTKFEGKYEEQDITENYGFSLNENGTITKGNATDEKFPANSKKFEVAGIDDDQLVYRFMQKLKSCNNCDDLAKFVDGKIDKAKCKKLLSYVKKMKYSDTSASWRGVMVGSGEIYINSVENKLTITALNL